MSLLSNLLAFSSLNTSAQKQQRSASANSRFFFENEEPIKVTEPKQRVASKSLSKMGLMSNLSQTKIDPKYRCLHRIAHNLSMKVRKHYYALFVTLQTMKKNNISLSKKPKIDKDRLEAGVIKIQQTFSIIYLKQYENSYKTDSFSKVKNYSQKNYLIKTLEKVQICNEYRFCGKKLFAYLNQLDKLSMKTELMEGSLEPVIKKSNTNCLRQSFSNIKQYRRDKTIEVSPKKEQRTVSIFQIYDNMQKKISASSEKTQQSSKKDISSSVQQNKKVDESNHTSQWKKLASKNQKQICKIEQPSLQSNLFNSWQGKISNFVPPEPFDYTQDRRQSLPYVNNVNQDTNNRLSTPYQSRFQSLQNSPGQKSYSKNKSPYRSCKKVPNLRESVAQDGLESRMYQKIYKCYKVTLDYDEKSFDLSSNYESVPKKLHKINPQQFAFPEVQDLGDKSNIFRDFKSSKISSFDSLEISNVVGEPFMRAETLISDIQRNRERYENSSEKSEISYAPYLPNDGSCSSINNPKEQINFGCDTVNFKNSLVMQRESMKKTQRQKVDTMLKKKTILMGVEADHQSQQLQHLKNNKRKYKNQYSDRKVSEQMLGNNFEQSYIFDGNFQIKRDPSLAFDSIRSKNVTTNYNGYIWEDKKSHHEYNSEGKNKSFSFNSNSSDAIPRRLRFNGMEYEKRSGDDIYGQNIYPSSTNSSFRNPMSWKNQLLENRSEMPVRDVGFESFQKMRAKNNISAQSQLHISKESTMAPKKFINISKR